MPKFKNFSKRIFTWYEMLSISIPLTYKVFSFICFELIMNLQAICERWVKLDAEKTNFIINYIPDMPYYWQAIIMLLLLLACFLEGGYRVVVKKDNLIKDLGEKIKKLCDINFSISIDNVSLLDSTRTGIILEATIINSGLVASIAKNWQLKVILVDGNSIGASFIPHSLREDFDFKLSNGSRLIKKEDALEAKTGNNPIVGGGEVRGILTFLANISINHIEFPEKKLILSVNDQCDKTYTIEKKISGFGPKIT